jgi:hypothetical protein
MFALRDIPDSIAVQILRGYHRVWGWQMRVMTVDGYSLILDFYHQAKNLR